MDKFNVACAHTSCVASKRDPFSSKRIARKIVERVFEHAAKRTLIERSAKYNDVSFSNRLHKLLYCLVRILYWVFVILCRNNGERVSGQIPYACFHTGGFKKSVDMMKKRKCA